MYIYRCIAKCKKTRTYERHWTMLFIVFSLKQSVNTDVNLLLPFYFSFFKLILAVNILRILRVSAFYSSGFVCL